MAPTTAAAASWVAMPRHARSFAPSGGPTSCTLPGSSRSSGSAETAWLAVPLELSLASLAGPLGFDVGAAALVPLRRNDFSVDGVGVAYRSLPVGALVSLRGVGVWVL